MSDNKYAVAIFTAVVKYSR